MQGMDSEDRLNANGGGGAAAGGDGAANTAADRFHAEQQRLLRSLERDIPESIATISCLLNTVVKDEVALVPNVSFRADDHVTLGEWFISSARNNASAFSETIAALKEFELDLRQFSPCQSATTRYRYLRELERKLQNYRFTMGFKTWRFIVSSAEALPKLLKLERRFNSMSDSSDCDRLKALERELRDITVFSGCPHEMPLERGLDSKSSYSNPDPDYGYQPDTMLALRIDGRTCLRSYPLDYPEFLVKYHIRDKWLPGDMSITWIEFCNMLLYYTYYGFGRTSEQFIGLAEQIQLMPVSAHNSQKLMLNKLCNQLMRQDNDICNKYLGEVLAVVVRISQDQSITLRSLICDYILPTSGLDAHDQQIIVDRWSQEQTPAQAQQGIVLPVPVRQMLRALRHAQDIGQKYKFVDQTPLGPSPECNYRYRDLRTSIYRNTHNQLIVSGFKGDSGRDFAHYLHDDRDKWRSSYNQFVWDPMFRLNQVVSGFFRWRPSTRKFVGMSELCDDDEALASFAEDNTVLLPSDLIKRETNILYWHTCSSDTRLSFSAQLAVKVTFDECGAQLDDVLISGEHGELLKRMMSELPRVAPDADDNEANAYFFKPNAERNLVQIVNDARHRGEAFGLNLNLHKAIDCLAPYKKDHPIIAELHGMLQLMHLNGDEDNRETFASDYFAPRVRDFFNDAASIGELLHAARIAIGLLEASFHVYWSNLLGPKSRTYRDLHRILAIIEQERIEVNPNFAVGQARWLCELLATTYQLDFREGNIEHCIKSILDCVRLFIASEDGRASRRLAHPVFVIMSLVQPFLNSWVSQEFMCQLVDYLMHGVLVANEELSECPSDDEDDSLQSISTIRSASGQQSWQKRHELAEGLLNVHRLVDSLNDECQNQSASLSHAHARIKQSVMGWMQNSGDDQFRTIVANWFVEVHKYTCNNPKSSPFSLMLAAQGRTRYFVNNSPVAHSWYVIADAIRSWDVLPRDRLVVSSGVPKYSTISSADAIASSQSPNRFRAISPMVGLLADELDSVRSSGSAPGSDRQPWTPMPAAAGAGADDGGSSFLTPGGMESAPQVERFIGFGDPGSKPRHSSLSLPTASSDQRRRNSAPWLLYSELDGGDSDLTPEQQDALNSCEFKMLGIKMRVRNLGKMLNWGARELASVSDAHDCETYRFWHVVFHKLQQLPISWQQFSGHHLRTIQQLHGALHRLNQNESITEDWFESEARGSAVVGNNSLSFGQAASGGGSGNSGYLDADMPSNS